MIKVKRIIAILAIVLMTTFISVEAFAAPTVQEYINKANGLMSLGSYEEAIQNYDKVLEQEPNNYTAIFGKASALSQLKKFEESLKYYDRAIELNPKNPGAFNNRAYVLNNLKKYEDSIKSADKAIEIDPRHTSAYRNKGTALLNLGKYEDALKTIEKAIELEPNYSEEYFKKGRALSAMSKYDEAIGAISKALELGPVNPSIYYYMSQAYAQSDKVQEAIEFLMKSIQLDERYKVMAKGSPAFNKMRQTEGFILATAPSVSVNGVKIVLDVPPTTINGKMLLPARAIFEALGAAVEWDGETQTATGTRKGTVVKIKIDSKEAIVNNKTVMLEMPAITINGRTLLPARFIAESFGAKVDWDPSTETAVITISK